MFRSMRDRHEGRHRCGGRGFAGMEEMMAMGGGFSRRGFGHGGRGGGRGFGDDGEGGRIGRLLIRGDLRLIALALIEKEPRHGYELIKQIEEMTGGWYAPSPGVVYPTLTYLEEAGYVQAEAEGNKKLYSITAEGRSHLDENRKLIDRIFEKLSAIGERIERRRERHDGRDGDQGQGPALPRSLDTALLHLRETIARKIEADATKGGDIVKLLLGVADDIEKGSN